MILSVIVFVFIGFIIVNTAVYNLTNPTDPTPSPEETLIQSWELDVQFCEYVNSLEELNEFVYDLQYDLNTVDYQIEEYVRSSAAADKIADSRNQVTECVNEKKRNLDFLVKNI